MRQLQQCEDCSRPSLCQDLEFLLWLVCELLFLKEHQNLFVQSGVKGHSIISFTQTQCGSFRIYKYEKLPKFLLWLVVGRYMEADLITRVCCWMDVTSCSERA